MAASSLCAQAREPAECGWCKLRCMMKYLQPPRALPLIAEGESGATQWHSGTAAGHLLRRDEAMLRCFHACTPRSIELSLAGKSRKAPSARRARERQRQSAGERKAALLKKCSVYVLQMVSLKGLYLLT